MKSGSWAVGQLGSSKAEALRVLRTESACHSPCQCDSLRR